MSLGGFFFTFIEVTHSGRTWHYSGPPLNTMKYARFLALLFAMAALLYAFADAYPRQFCSPNGEVVSIPPFLGLYVAL